MHDSREDGVDSDEADMTDLVVRSGINGLSIEYRPPKQIYW